MTDVGRILAQLTAGFMQGQTNGAALRRQMEEQRLERERQQEYLRLQREAGDRAQVLFEQQQAEHLSPDEKYARDLRRARDAAAARAGAFKEAYDPFMRGNFPAIAGLPGGMDVVPTFTQQLPQPARPTPAPTVGADPQGLAAGATSFEDLTSKVLQGISKPMEVRGVDEGAVERMSWEDMVAKLAPVSGQYGLERKMYDASVEGAPLFVPYLEGTPPTAADLAAAERKTELEEANLRAAVAKADTAEQDATLGELTLPGDVDRTNAENRAKTLVAQRDAGLAQVDLTDPTLVQNYLMKRQVDAATMSAELVKAGLAETTAGRALQWFKENPTAMYLPLTPEQEADYNFKVTQEARRAAEFAAQERRMWAQLGETANYHEQTLAVGRARIKAGVGPDGQATSKPASPEQVRMAVSTAQTAIEQARRLLSDPNSAKLDPASLWWKVDALGKSVGGFSPAVQQSFQELLRGYGRQYTATTGKPTIWPGMKGRAPADPQESARQYMRGMGFYMGPTGAAPAGGGSPFAPPVYQETGDEPAVW